MENSLPKKSEKISKAAKRKEKVEAVIDEYRRIADWPRWFKGLSLFQMNAANSILNNLRDDMAQGTTDRIRITLETLGLDPLIKSKQIREVMHLSRGNDLAFVWFLWQMHYLEERSPINLKYSHNEKVLLTTITHLDTVTTLRALDRILPVQKQKPPVIQPEKKKRFPKKYESPYFQPLRKPVLKLRKPFVLKHKPAQFGCYTVYTDPHYIVPNEANRWYVNYDVDPSKRVCMGIINKTIDEIDIENNKSDEDDELKSKCPKDILKKIIDSLPKTADERSRENKLRVQKFRGCLSRLNPGENRKMVTRRKVLKNIENDVEAFKEKSLKQLTRVYNKNQRKLQSCVNPITLDCNKCDNCEAEDNYEEGYNLSKLYDAMSSDTNISSASSGLIRMNCDVPMKQLVAYDDNNKFDSFKIIDLNKYEESVVKTETPTVVIKAVRKCEIQFDKVISGYDFGHCCTPRSDEVFFEAPGHHKPLKFIFNKIFNVEDIENHNPYKSGLNSALGSSQKKTEDEALLEYCKAMWQFEVDIWQTTYKNIEKIFKHTYPKIKLNKYARDYYDPRDTELMNNLLSDALNELKKEKKYVLASLPESQKIPRLKQWILARYGLIYTEKERLDQLRKSIKFFRALKARELIVSRIPFSEVRTLSYNCHEYLYKRSLWERKNYEYHFRKDFMDPIATFWAAMQPYSYENHPPRSTFYAYMPANVYNMLIFKPWQSNEYRDVFQFRRNRMRQNS